MALFSDALVVVRGGGDLASGAVYRLVCAGFPVVVTELAAPLFVRRAVSYGEAVYSGQITVDGVTARQIDADDRDALAAVVAGDDVAVCVDPDGLLVHRLQPAVVVDARMEKRNLGTRLDDAPLVVALGPGFTAGADCHAVIETNRGHDLGRVIVNGSAEPDTGEPGSVREQTHSRVLRASAAGHVRAHSVIGDRVSAGTVVASVDDVPVIAAFDGVVRGLIHERVAVTAGMKIGDLDPRARRENCFTISDKSLAVGGGVVEAVLRAPQIRRRLAPDHAAPRGV